MSKPANKTVIGIFVVGAIALVVLAIVVLGSGKFFKKTLSAVCYFEGDVGGLSVGAPVVFRGVKVGSVGSVKLRASPDPDPKKVVNIRIPVFLELDPEAIEREKGAQREPEKNLKQLIAVGLRGKLETQSIVTGQRQINLDLFPDKPAKFVGADPEYIEIPTIPTPMEEFVKKIEKIPFEEIFEKLRSTLAEVDKIVKSPEIPAAIRSVRLALEDVQKMVRNLDGQVGPLVSNLNDTVKDVRGFVQNADTKITALASGLDGTVKDVRGFIQNADTRITGLTSNLDETVKEVRGVVKNVDTRIEPMSAGIEGTLKSLDVTLIAAQKTLENISGTAGEDSPMVYQMNRTLEEVHSLARSIRLLADYLERHPESLIRGK